MGVAAGLAEGAHLVVERLPVASEHVGARDDDVYLAGAGGDGGANLVEVLGEGILRGGEAGGDGGDGNLRAGERLHGDGNKVVVDADGADADAQAERAQPLEKIRTDGLARLGGEAAHRAGGVVAGERGEV